MKIALIIFRIGPSHGSILQTYALTRILESMGHEVTIIDRHRPLTINKLFKALLAIMKRIITLKFNIDGIYITEYPKDVMSNINVFIDRELRKQTLRVSRDTELRRIGKAAFDAYIVGSDQTWRPKYVYNIYNYYLDFVPQNRIVKRLAYAPSFGTSDWEYTVVQEDRCNELIKLFDGVSVRELDGVSLCKSHYKINAVHVLDPTMLLTADNYLKVIHKSTNKESFVGYVFLDKTDEKLKIVQKICNIIGLKAKQILLLNDAKNPRVEDKAVPSIDSWISNIVNSDFIVTDSYHATVFSLLFHRPFITVANENRGLSRISSLLGLFNFEDRLINNESQIMRDIMIYEKDWMEFERILKITRDKSISFLASHLN